MTTTRRILLSATSMLVSAGAGVAAGHNMTVAAATVGHESDDDHRVDGDGRDDRDDERDERRSTGRADRDDDCDDDDDDRCAPATTRPRGSTSVVTVPVTRPPRPGTTAPVPTTRPAPPTGTTVRPRPTTTVPSATTVPTATTSTTAPVTTPPPTTSPATTSPGTTVPAADTPTVRAEFDNLVAGRRVTVPSPDSPDRGLVARFTLTNPAAVARPVRLAIEAASPAGFPRYLEAADFSGGGLTCVTGTGAAYYKTATTTASFTCTGTLRASSTATITVSSGSVIAAAAVGQTATISGVVDPGGDNRTLLGTFTAATTTPPTTVPPTTVPPATTLPPPTSTTTLPPPTTVPPTTVPPTTVPSTTLPPPTSTTTPPTATTLPPPTSTTTVPPTTVPPTTVPPTTVPPTTVPPTTVPPTTTTTVAPTTTTTAAPTAPTVDASFVNLRPGTRVTTASPDNPDRGFVALVTVSNATSAARAVTVKIDGSTAAGFPRYLEAADVDRGAFTCVTATNAAYYKASTTAASFTCTGTLPAGAASAITLSSGSMIAAGAQGQNVTVVATATPGGATRTLQGTFN